MRYAVKALTTISLAIALAMPAFTAQALEERPVYAPSGEVVFKLRFFDQGDGPFMPDDPPLESTWNLNTRQKDKIQRAMDLWAELIKPQAGELPAIVNVGTFDDENAAGLSMSLVNQDISITQLQAALMGLEGDGMTLGAHAHFVMGKMDFDSLDYLPSQTPRSHQTDMTGVAFHELAHGLGITSDIQNKDGPNLPHYSAALGSWASRLRDDNGNAARPGQSVICSMCDTPYDATAFDVRKDQAYFTGSHVTEVLDGAMRGVPVKMLGERASGEIYLDNNYMSHSELKNSMMSHQSYRNYFTLMEAELAFMQDMGYSIDRRNFFGYSVYGNGRNLVNEHGFFQRNSAGTAYLPGQYNTSTLGLGLHIYGSGNTVTQRADLLTKGPGGAGVRVDGAGNTLIVPAGTRVHADGLNGRGVMFSYGKGHSLVQRGEVQALGELGVGVSFDFGNNQLGNNVDYRGSYLRTSAAAKLAMLDELNGPLVDRYDLTGRVAGSAAAIYISPNAYVGQINIMQGAHVHGGIISHYAQTDEHGQPRLTQLSFGQRADEHGRATGQADPQFSWRHSGTIQGIDNLKLVAQGGHTAIDGHHEIHGVKIARGAVLSGNGHYTLASAGAFVNDGTLAPGNSIGRIDIVGNYRQGNDGRLVMDVNGAGAHDVLAVSGIADLGGTLTVVPQAGDWYGPAWSLRSDELVQAGAASGSFSSINARLDSPTLTLETSPVDAHAFALRIGRLPTAYSQYGRNDNAREVGRALYERVPQVRADSQSLYRILDFSAMDGSLVARSLDQFSPAAYSALAASSLNRERQVSDLVNARRISPSRTESGPGQWQAYAVPFGGETRQDSRGSAAAYDASSYGLVFGAEKPSVKYKNWAWGFHGAVTQQSARIHAPYNAKGETTALNLGLGARFGAHDGANRPTTGLYAFGGGQIGIEDGSIERQISVDAYTAQHRSRWTGLSTTLSAGAGYRWALGDSLSAGPIATLNYTLLTRPRIDESGNDATRLALASNHFNSLRSSLGANASVKLRLKSGAALQADVQLTWDRELLNTGLTQAASFAAYPSIGFSSRNDIAGRDSLGLRAGLAYEANKDLALGARLASQLFQSGYRSVTGDVFVNWRF